MAQKTRQARLFAAEDFKVVYDSFINADLQSYDYDTIRTAMVNYISSSYPENYNDWIESAEFVALLDVVAQFGHNLAFRVDLNSRNNFLSTAERQDSVYKLAEFLGYTPMRNVPAFGEMKIVSVKTNEAVIGSAGTSLGGIDVRFENTNNVNNLDDFITVMNAIMQTSNSFGNPKKLVTIDNIPHQFYKLSTVDNQIKFDISGSVAGQSGIYNVVSMDYDATRDTKYEQSPTPNNAFGIYYKNDGNGVNSKDTGFFVGIKQGALTFKDFTIDESLDSMVLDINATNINQTDVWVQTIDANGVVEVEWSKVENVYGQNEIYNSLPGTERNIFSVKTRENNQISVCFADKNFGNTPKGTIRVWYRTSVNQSYTVGIDDLGQQRISIRYTGIDGNEYVAIFNIQLATPIKNASSSETLDNIKVSAPRNYSAQNRMITASDYNNLMSTLNTNVVKTKAINRTHSGHSRYINNMDPTGTYNSLDIYGKDGKLFSHNITKVINTSGEQSTLLFNKYVRNLLDNPELINLYYTKFTNTFNSLIPTTYPINSSITYTANTIGAFVWQTTSSSTVGNDSGYIVEGTQIKRVGSTQTNILKNIEVGTMIEFLTPSNTKVWAKVVNIFNSGLGNYDQNGEPTGLTSSGSGSIMLDAEVPDFSYIMSVYPAFNRQFTDREKNIIINYLANNKTFAMYYDIESTGWEVFEPDPNLVPNDPSSVPVNFESNQASWLIWFEYDNNKFDIYVRTNRIEFSSDNVEFNNINNEYRIDTYTSKAEKDTIDILGDDFESNGKFFVTGYYRDKNGVSNQNRVILSLTDKNSDNRPDNPRAFDNIVNGYILYDVDMDDDIETVSGKENVRFEWQHNPDDNILINPSFTNIIDVFVLDKTYDHDYKNYLIDDINNPEPSVPTAYDLKSMFKDGEHKKSISDTIVYRPVVYKPLFGPKAEESLRARFRVIKLQGSNVTDNDVKTRIIEVMQEYFSTDNWDFGETFYFTELAAFVHQKLSGIISSFVIVPQGTNSVFGNLFEINPQANEMFIPDVSINDIDIIENITENNIRAGQ